MTETINSRLKYLRKKVLEMRQDDFGSKIKLTGSTISKIEAGEISLTDRNITAICDAYLVSETWLRTGDGDPFEKPDIDSQILAGAGRFMNGKDSFEKSMIAMMLQMNEDDWAQIKKFIRKIASFLDDIEDE